MYLLFIYTIYSLYASHECFVSRCVPSSNYFAVRIVIDLCRGIYYDGESLQIAIVRVKVLSDIFKSRLIITIIKQMFISFFSDDSENLLL